MRRGRIGIGFGFAPPTAGQTSVWVDGSTHIILSNSDYTAEVDTNSWYITLASSVKSAGKKYVEFYADALSDAAALSEQLWTVCLRQGVSDVPDFNEFHGGNGGNQAYTRAGTSAAGGATGIVTYTSGNDPTHSAAPGDTVALAIDFDAGKAWIARNNTFGGSPAAGTNPAFSWTPNATNWEISWSGHRGGGAVNPKATLRTASTTQSFAPPSGFSTWDGV
jgi:hypothetical protein